MRDGPAWLGIGAQRSGTTWLTDLLTQHPGIGLNARQKKELHFFDRFGREQWSDAYIEEYRSLFRDGVAGEFTPACLRCPWVPPLVRRTCPEALIIVILRDPIERYASAMRHYERLRHLDGNEPADDWIRFRSVDAAWGGMYADHLSMWDGFDLHLIQYEKAVADPQSTVDAIWRRLGLTPIPLADVEKPSRTSTDSGFAWPAGLKDSLRRLYASQAERLDRLVDLSLWPTFSE